MLPLLKIADRIEADTDSGIAWSISTDDLISLMEVSAAAFYRALYELKKRINLNDALRHFNRHNVGDLVTVLERFYGDDAEAVMARTGLFLPHPVRVELMELLLRCVDDSLEIHMTDFNSFRAMLGVYGNYDRAVRTYLDENIKLEPLIYKSIERYGDVPGKYFSTTAADYLESLFIRHVLDRRYLFAPLEAKLRLFAREHGYIIDGGETRSRRNGGSGSVTAEVSRKLSDALRIFGFQSSNVSGELLKQRYKSLLKKYHPDLNPQGLEQCKRINSSYAFLVQRVTSRT